MVWAIILLFPLVCQSMHIRIKYCFNYACSLNSNLNLNHIWKQNKKQILISKKCFLPFPVVCKGPQMAIKSWCTGTGNFGFISLYAFDIYLQSKNMIFLYNVQGVLIMFLNPDYLYSRDYLCKTVFFNTLQMFFFKKIDS